MSEDEKAAPRKGAAVHLQGETPNGIRSIVLLLGLEVGLGVLAGGAHLRSLRSLAHVAAVAALPPYLAVALEEVAVRQAAQQLQIALFMLRFDRGDHPERRGDLRETLFGGHLSELGVEHVPLLVLPLRRGEQVLLRRADLAGGVAGRDFDHAAFEELEETFGMLLLLFRGLGEYACDLFVSFLLGLAGEEDIAAAGLALAGEGFQQILFGTRTFDALFHIFFDVCGHAKLLQKSEMRKDIVIELSYKGFS